MRAALKTFRACRVPEVELRREWRDQKEAQMLARSHAPARLRRQLDKVFTLQTQIDDAKQTIAVSGAPPDAVSLLHSLEATHGRLNQQAEELYTSLNIGGSFPELADLPWPFVHTLLILNDLKTVIRRRAIASFQEWEVLDRAVAGRREPLGTKLYQATRNAISKRQPALLKLIDRFNENCAKLDALCLSDPTLYEDVCISPSPGRIPRWLNDDDVHNGIWSLHIINRCREEAFRLNLDRANLRVWLNEELSIVDNTLASHSNTTLMLPLQERQRLLNHLKHRWAQQLQPQHLPSGLPLGFHPAEGSSTSPPQSRTFSIAAIPSVRDSTLKPDAQMLDVDGDLEEDSDLDDPGFTDVPTGSRHIAEDGALYPGSINDPEDAADLIGNDGEGEDGEGKAEETSGLNVDDHFEIRWDSEYGRNLDRSLLQDLRIQNASRIILYERFSHFVVCGGVLYTLEIEPVDLDRFLAPRGRLNGEGINSVMASLYIIFSGSYSPYAVAATRCAVLSTYDLTRAQYNASDSDLWRFLGPTEYWTKSMWLLPIHQSAEQHWVCAVVDLPSQSIHFYNSLASESGWHRDLRVGSAAPLHLPNLTLQ
ncbi:ULP-PROTEASE domain-containing protein [Mycena venus]|uniref:ULP-PROTEASE domain-containing protein n=1 Tax=Mycena venus TaxID=2733690 RepID=A0A8H7CK84_9AGAR|nr:ULP-PROTEASE domain-containing protein [Mycena venus]